ncbi:VC0807 family protein [Kitasatospora sp. NPDC006697]|uniref:VC0807 family protein n=1 Tax=Kitasatospora sp. NPDC006697 TaxID=3364020 RepID=UPI0036AB7EA0
MKRPWVVRGIRIVVDLGIPTALFYGLRAFGLSIYLTLVIAAVLPAAVAVVRLLRSGKIEGLALFMMSVMLISTVVSLIDGSPQFLLARGAWMTGIAGFWFIGSAWATRPLAFHYTRPVLEHRTRIVSIPGDWDELWERLPKFRRIWRIGSILWGISLLGDSAARVVMAYTLPANLVPALGNVLYLVTSLVLIVITNIYYVGAGLYDRRSRLYAPLAQAEPAGPVSG